jgi:hypothetical protein
MGFMRLACIVSFAALAAACSDKPSRPSSPPDRPPRPARPATPPAPAPAPEPPPITAGQPGSPVPCEVEMSGTFAARRPLPKGREYVLYVSNGDCLENGRVIQRLGGHTGTEFFTEVFVPCGTHLGVCGAVETPNEEPQPTTAFGKVERDLLAVGRGEITFKKLVIEIKPGPRRTFPPWRPAPL